ncbi:MAG: DUF1223 domain-containing protein [Acidobacteriaceae bacterium]|nr:DUF1223 domain-containing protein [Acidobacteriaceae bacterium]
MQAAESEKTPVLLELFTSLGCSSCPPADKLLAEIDRQQPIAGARLIVLSEHVDYWNTPQWSDPFASATYTERQQAYDSRLGVEAYTPQLVIDGSSALVGGNWAKTADAIQHMLHGARIAVHVTATRQERKAQIDIAAGPSVMANKARVFLALAHNQVESHVGGGENAGRDLSEVAVAYSIKQLGKMDGGANFSKSVSIDLPAKSEAGDLRVIAFVRRSDTLQVIGADQLVF